MSMEMQPGADVLVIITMQIKYSSQLPVSTEASTNIWTF